MLLLVAIWGINFPIIKGAFADIPPFAFNGFRFLVAAALLLIALRVLEGPPRFAREDLLGLLALGLVGHVGFQSLFIAGLARTTAGNSSLIMSMAPLFIGVLGVVLGLEHPSVRMWAVLFVAFVGLLVLIEGRGGGRLSLATAAGDLLVLASAFCWAAYTVLSRAFLTRMSALRLTTVTLILGLPVLVAAAVPGLLHLDWTAVALASWGAVAFSAVLAIVVCYVIWYTSVQAVGSTRTAALSNLIPVVALVAARLLLGEPLGVLQVVGGGVVLFGVWLARSGSVDAR